MVTFLISRCVGNLSAAIVLTKIQSYNIYSVYERNWICADDFFLKKEKQSIDYFLIRIKNNIRIIYYMIAESFVYQVITTLFPSNHQHFPTNHQHFPSNHQHFPSNHQHFPSNHQHFPTNHQHLKYIHNIIRQITNTFPTKDQQYVLKCW